jgi:hypothetical protein
VVEVSIFVITDCDFSPTEKLSEFESSYQYALLNGDKSRAYQVAGDVLEFITSRGAKSPRLMPI